MTQLVALGSQTYSLLFLLQTISLMLCLQDSTQDVRAGGGSNTSSHMVQEVVVVHPSRTQLNLQWSGYNPVRFFVLVQQKAEHDDTETDGG